jgi:hypothetical protein
MNAGTKKTYDLTVANYTDKTLDVELTVKQFSVNNYSYSYIFNQPSSNWLTLGVNELTLKPGQNTNVPYVLNIPSGVKPGGNYYTLFASSTSSGSGIKSTIQAASLIYLTVNGKLTYNSVLNSDHIPLISFGKQISYKFNVTDVGNVYYFVYVSGELHGLSAKPASTPASHLVLPGKIRTFSGIIASPVLPGIYKATFGYKLASGKSVEKSHYIIYLPVWFICLVFIILLGLNTYYLKIRRPKRNRR